MRGTNCLLILCIAALLNTSPALYAQDGHRTNVSSVPETLVCRIDDGAVVAASPTGQEEKIIAEQLPFPADDGAPVLYLPSLKQSSRQSSAPSPATVLVGTEGGIQCSPDGGITWMKTLIQPGMSPVRFEVREHTPGGRSIFLIASLDHKDNTSMLWLSRNGGMSWHKAAVLPQRAEEVDVDTYIAEKKAQSTLQQRQAVAYPVRTAADDALPFDITWSEPVMISDTNWGSLVPRIALSGEDTVHVAWSNLNGGHNMSYSRSTDGGLTFSPEREVFPGDTFGFRPHILVEKSKVYLFFTNGNKPHIPIMYIHMLVSTDYGDTWSIRARPFPEEGITEQVRNLGDTLLLLYPPTFALPDEDAIRLFVSTDGGLTWTMRDDHYFWASRMDISQEALHIVTENSRFIGGRAYETGNIRSHDLGITFCDTTLLSKNDSWYSDLPIIKTFSPQSGLEQAWAVWRDTRYGWYGNLGAGLPGRFLLPGNFWTEEEPYTLPDWPNGSEPSLAATSKLRAVVCLLDFWDQWHAGVAWTDNGLTQFAPMLDLTPGKEVTDAPAIAVSDNAIHVVYDQADRVADSYHIWYRKGTIHRRDAHGTIGVPQEVSMDSTGIHRTDSASFSVRYSASDTLWIGSIIVDHPHFTVDPPQGAIYPGQESLEVSITYSNTVAARETAHVYVYHNGPSSPEVLTVTAEAGWEKCQTSYGEGRAWQLVSLPLQPAAAVPFRQLFTFTGGRYRPADTLVPAVGYWAKPDTDAVLFAGTSFHDVYGEVYDTIRVEKGWNLVAVAAAVPVAADSLLSIPLGNAASLFYGYTGEGYQAVPVLEPGRAYFFKAKEEGKLVIRNQ